MTELGTGLHDAARFEDALSVKEAVLSMERRLGDSEEGILIAQNNLACPYQDVGRHEEALCLRRDVYSGRLKLNGEEHEMTLAAASNYASSLITQERFEEAKSLSRKMIPVARRFLGESHDLTLKLRWFYARTLYRDAGATLGDLREAVTTVEETARTARRVMGGAHPLVRDIERTLQNAREALAARDEA